MSNVIITVIKDDGSSITYYLDEYALINIEQSRLESAVGATTINLTGRVLRIKNDLK